MTDVLSPAQRSHCMSKNRPRDTQPEVRLRKALWAKGYRYRLHYRIFGRPDFAFVGKKVAVFVDGCFWHGCPAHYQAPSSNSEKWRAKLIARKERDEAVNRRLRSEGWEVIRFWEHSVRSDIEGCVEIIGNRLRK